MQKARRHPTQGHRPLAGMQFQDLFHPPVRGAFHLSLTVLVRYRSSGSIQPCRMVPADSAGVPPAPAYSGIPPYAGGVGLRGFHALRRRLPAPSPCPPAYYSGPYNPARALTRAVWARPLSLATTRGITIVFSSWGYLDVSVPPVRPHRCVHPLLGAGCPVREPRARWP